ncbi:hypothetical protein STAFG_2219 [Streptomyces afghaniensis 772]|uniref:Uncharacterized protein n=1 Tax=Streptomyces afghaniensis 772 TaxID=1283301 RepID=S4NQJ5_9ACTN|nr:hypothetical protein STAFG_2219 [Streptomyces afghaniensis 772]
MPRLFGHRVSWGYGAAGGRSSSLTDQSRVGSERKASGPTKESAWRRKYAV